MRFGVHISISGGFNAIVERALERTCETIQIFTRNPRGWAPPKNFSKVECEGFNSLLMKNNIFPLIVHLPYLPNIASPDNVLYNRSIDVLSSDIIRADTIGASYVVIHTGNYGNSTPEFGLQRIINSLNIVLKSVDNGVIILLENMYGGGSWLGNDLNQLKYIIEQIVIPDRIGVCFDLCHAYCTGYDISSQEGVENTVELFDKLIGLEKMMVIHANDSKSPCGSKVDRHSNIGQGFIGREGFSAIVNHPLLQNKPVILETPMNEPDDDIKNLAIIRSLIK